VTGSGGSRRPAGVGRRRGEPLVASWDPRPAGEGPDAGRAHPRHRVALGLVALVLLVLTGSVLARTLLPADEAPEGPPAPQRPVVGEAPTSGDLADAALPALPTAELPPGGDFPVSGRGTWRVVPGTTTPVGRGRPFTYTVEIEDGAVVAEGDQAFAAAVDATLGDPRSWVGSGQVALRRVDAAAGQAPDFRVSLTSQLTTRARCGYQIRYEASCWQSDLGRVLINGARWVRGAGAFEGQLGLYRQYAINHEVGHVLGNPHVPCGTGGALAPVMMQQSFGVSDDYLAQLTDASPQGGDVPRDGKVCRPNAWPFPGGGPAPG
jgi:hypothetical protein